MLKSNRRGATFADRSESGDDFGGVYGEWYCCCGGMEKKELVSSMLFEYVGGGMVTVRIIEDVRVFVGCCGL